MSKQIKDRDHDYFMTLACVAAKRSKDPVTQVGATVVDKRGNMLGLGYNGMPRGCHDDVFPWGKGSNLDNKHLYVCHAELNALVNSNGQVRGGCMYVTLFPCNECAKLIIQFGIKEIVYLSDKHVLKNSTIAAKKMFDSAGVKYWHFVPESNVVIEFPKATNNNVISEDLSDKMEILKV